jgi:type VI protein secretion system component Hcp
MAGTAVAIVRNAPVRWREIQLQGDDSMSDELKKDPQTPEVEGTELSGKDLEEVEGGVSLNYGTIQWTYTQQKSDGSTDGTKK